VTSHYNRAIACHKLQLYQQALMSLEIGYSTTSESCRSLKFTRYSIGCDEKLSTGVKQLSASLSGKSGLSCRLYHCAIVLEQLKRPQEAISYYQQAIALKPNYSKAISNLASLYMGLQQYSQAVEAFSQLLAVEPDYPYAAGKLFYLQTHICDWSNYHASVELLRLPCSATASTYCSL
jgi:tetratricopeptide (TPR) repeat protein